METHSDHRYIFFELGARIENNTVYEEPIRWARGKLNRQALANFLRLNEPAVPDQADPVNTTSVALGDYLVKACDSCMPRRGIQRRRKAVHWWTEEIANLRRDSIASYRALKRAIRSKGPELCCDEHNEYRAKKSTLRTAIKKAQETSWKRLCDEVERDPWGLPFRVVTKKHRGNVPALRP